MKKIRVLFLSGLQNDCLVRVASISNLKTSYIMSGSCNVYFNLEDSRLNKKYFKLDLKSNQKVNFDNIDIVFNQISDADSHSKVLMKLRRILEVKKIKTINHPRYILQTSREKIYNKLIDIPKLKVPKTIKIVPLHPDDIKNKIMKHSFTFPVILRKLGTHGGESIKLIYTFDELYTLYDVALDGSAFYLIQYINYKEENVYRKFRLVVVEGEVYVRHVIYSDKWMIHSRSRDFMKKNKIYQEKESIIIDSFEKNLKNKIQQTITKIYKRLKVDYFGIDCSIDKDYNILIFELNANMNILTNSSKTLLSTKPTNKIKKAIGNMIFNKAVKG